MWSIWEKEFLIGKPDFTVIGSGIVGLNAAIEYKRLFPKHSVTVIEAGSLPSGASTKNAGFACFGSVGELLMDQQEGFPVFSTLEKRWKGLQRLRQMLGDKHIEFEPCGSQELFQENETAHFESCITSIKQLNEKVREIIGTEPYRVNELVIKKNGFRNVIGAIENQSEGLINTGKMMMRLLDLARENGVKILNGFRIERLEETENGVFITSKDGRFMTRNCLVAANGFAQSLLPGLKVTPARAQVLVTNEIDNLPVFGSFHMENGFYYFRHLGKRLLLGGGRHMAIEDETTTLPDLNCTIQRKLDALLKEVILPDTAHEVAHRWTGIMGVGGDKSPIIKHVSKRIGCAVKLGGMGIAIGTITGQEGAHLFESIE